MIIAQGQFIGRGGHTMRGGYSVTEVAGVQIFSTTADFFFDGAPEPGFALSPDGALTHSNALATDFLRLLPDVNNLGIVTAPLPSGFDIRAQKTVFLWCYFAKFLLGMPRLCLMGIENVQDIVFDEKVYNKPADLFLSKLTERIVLAFARAGLIKLSASGMSLEDEDICYEILFSFLIVIEGLERLGSKDETYLPTLVFAQFPDGIGPAPNPSSALRLIGTDVRTKFHGDLDAAIIQNAARKVASEV